MKLRFYTLEDFAAHVRNHSQSDIRIQDICYKGQMTGYPHHESLICDIVVTACHPWFNSFAFAEYRERVGTVTNVDANVKKTTARMDEIKKQLPEFNQPKPGIWEDGN